MLIRAREKGLEMRRAMLSGAISSLIFSAPLDSSLIPAKAVDSTYTFTRNDTDATVTDHEGLVIDVTANEARFVGARRVHNLATGLVTETITVISGNEYQVTIAGGSGDTAVASGAFTGTLTANGTNRISWNSGTPKTAGSTSLTLTVTGTLTQMLVEDVTGQANQNPSENVEIGAEHGTNVGNVKYFNYENDNTVSAGGVVTEAQGAAIPAATLKGVLIEQARTNIAQRSEEFDNAYWSVFECTVTADTQVSPDGSQNADTMTLTAALSYPSVSHNIPVTAGQLYTTSIYAKAGIRSTLSIEVRGTNVPAQTPDVVFNLTGAGSIKTQTRGVGGIELVGNGWYRCWNTLVASSGATETVIYGVGTFANEGVLENDTVHIWGAQMELGNFLTSYVPTLATANATRNVEALNYPNTNFSDGEGTAAIAFTPNASTAQYNASGIGRALVGVRGANADMLSLVVGKLRMNDGTNATNTATMPNLVAGVTAKVAGRWSVASSLMRIGQDTTEVEASFDGSFNVSTPLTIGYAGGNRLNGSFKNLKMFKKALSDSKFAALTA